MFATRFAVEKIGESTWMSKCSDASGLPMPHGEPPHALVIPFGPVPFASAVSIA